MTEMEALMTYRLRWIDHGRKHSRGYEREHFAVKALARLRAQGIDASLFSRPVVVMAPWTPYEKVHSQTLCTRCGRPIALVEDEWVDSDGATYCREESDSPRHSA